ncbi:MAG: glycosyltransferase family 2 protein [Chakrabartia sp.]
MDPDCKRGDAITVVIVNYRTPELTLRCVEALCGERRALPEISVVIVDGGSADGSAAVLQQGLDQPRFHGWTRVLPLAFNGGFGWANNQAMMDVLQQDAPPTFIHLLNPDTLIEPGAVVRLAEVAQQYPKAGAIGSQLIETDGQRSGSAFRFPSVAREFLRGAQTGIVGRLLGIKPILITSEDTCAADWVTGASVLLRSDALRDVGLFDDGFFLYFEEVELMHRMRRGGWDVLHAPLSRVMHIGGAATGVVSDMRKPMPPYWFQSRRRFFTRAYGPKRAWLASAGWLVGDSIWHVRKAVGLGRSGQDIPGERNGVLHHGLRAGPSDKIAAVARWSDPPGVHPAWDKPA